MANPGYPMQPMMQPPPGAPQVVRQGTSKAVPVVVSAGLAIGVFCGLLFGLGTGDDDATAATTTSSSTTTSTPTKPKTSEVAEPFQPTPPKQDVAAAGSNAAGSNAAKPAAGSGSAQVATTAAGSASGSGSAATVPPVPAKLVGKLTIEVKPDAIAKTAKIFVDGKQIEGNVYEADLTDLKPADPKKPEVKKAVKVLVKASGYNSIERSVDVVAAPNSENNNTFEVELSKRASSSTTPPRPPPPGGNKPKCKKPPCGLIDI
jgi:hypothetical protein